MIKGLVSAAFTLGVTMGAWPTIASADTSSCDSRDCVAGYVCLWGNRDWSGPPAVIQKSTGTFGTGYWNNDETSSVRNRSAYIVYLYKDASGKGTSKCLLVGYAH